MKAYSFEKACDYALTFCSKERKENSSEGNQLTCKQETVQKPPQKKIPEKPTEDYITYPDGIHPDNPFALYPWPYEAPPVPNMPTN